MIPLVSAQIMRECDARAVQRWGQGALVRAAGVSVAREAHRLLGSLYARRVAVVVGPGLNGADGRVAAQTLIARGCRVDVVEVARQPLELRGYDLVIDAAFGLGCSRPYVAPAIAGSTSVLAVDLPSGVDADTGDLLGRPLRADVTLALGALKVAHLDGEAARYCGELRFASLGIETPSDDGLVTDDDLTCFVRGDFDDHKWAHAVTILAGSPLMGGAAVLSCAGALSAGASMIQLETRGESLDPSGLAPEVVRTSDSGVDARSRCVVAGPGLGPDAPSWLRDRLDDTSVATVLDADALTPATVSLGRRAPRVLTPHAGEFTRIGGAAVGARRLVATRDLARATECVVLLKGPTTIVADPDGRVRIVNVGTPALATAGSGDVLAGMIGAAIARGHEPFLAAALSAHLHALAGRTLRPYESAGAIPSAVTAVLSALRT